MAAVEWSDALSIGIPQTDEEHRQLVEILNELDDAKRTGKGTRIMGDVLTRLIEYTVSHFESEEQLMEESGYPGFELHRKQHLQLVKKVGRFRDQFYGGGRRITKEMMEFLKYWLTNHILADDMAFGKFHTGRTADGSAPASEPVTSDA